MSLVKTIFEQMPRRFMRDKAVGIDGVIQYDVRGEGGGTWHLVIADGTCTLGEGPATDPRLTLQISTQDWLRLIAGKQSPEALFRTRGTRVGV